MKKKSVGLFANERLRDANGSIRRGSGERVEEARALEGFKSIVSYEPTAAQMKHCVIPSLTRAESTAANRGEAQAR